MNIQLKCCTQNQPRWVCAFELEFLIANRTHDKEKWKCVCESVSNIILIVWHWKQQAESDLTGRKKKK